MDRASGVKGFDSRDADRMHPDAALSYHIFRAVGQIWRSARVTGS
jgi:hypothetical protein